MPQPKAAPPALPAKGPEAKLFAVRNGIDKNAPCPCGSGTKYKKCCRKVEVDPAELALAQEEAAEKKAALAALVAQRQEAIRQAQEAQEAQAQEEPQQVQEETKQDAGENEEAVVSEDLAIQELPEGLFAESEEPAEDVEDSKEDEFFSKPTFEDI